MSGVMNLAKKTGVALAAAFGVKKLADFGKQCLELGSDLQEVQNVVDVTFPSMTAQVDKFAKSAAGSFGLSETMAKKFTGTFGAMAKSFGFSERAAYDMGHTEFHNNSCRNRNCPNCQAVLKEIWVDKRREEVIDAPYFHVVFTLPFA